MMCQFAVLCNIIVVLLILEGVHFKLYLKLFLSHVM